MTPRFEHISSMASGCLLGPSEALRCESESMWGDQLNLSASCASFSLIFFLSCGGQFVSGLFPESFLKKSRIFDGNAAGINATLSWLYPNFLGSMSVFTKIAAVSFQHQNPEESSKLATLFAKRNPADHDFPHPQTPRFNQLFRKA